MGKVVSIPALYVRSGCAVNIFSHFFMIFMFELSPAPGVRTGLLYEVLRLSYPATTLGFFPGRHRANGAVVNDCRQLLLALILSEMTDGVSSTLQDSFHQTEHAKIL